MSVEWLPLPGGLFKLRLVAHNNDRREQQSGLWPLTGTYILKAQHSLDERGRPILDIWPELVATVGGDGGEGGGVGELASQSEATLRRKYLEKFKKPPAKGVGKSGLIAALAQAMGLSDAAGQSAIALAYQKAEPEPKPPDPGWRVYSMGSGNEQE